MTRADRHYLYVLTVLTLVSGCGRTPLHDDEFVDGSDIETAQDIVVVDALASDGDVSCAEPVRVRGSESSVPIDILLVIEDGCKLVDERGNINCYMLERAQRWRRNVDLLWASLLETNVDATVTVFALDPEVYGPPAGFAGRFQGVPIREFAEIGFSVLGPVIFNLDAYAALLSGHRFYGRGLRPDARTHIVVVTDEGRPRVDNESFRAQMEETLGHGFTLHAVVSERVPSSFENPNGACVDETIGGATFPGEHYIELAAETGGHHVSICTNDWSDLLSTLSERIAIRTPIPCAVTLPRVRPPGFRYEPDHFVVQALSAGTRSIVPRSPLASDMCTRGWWYFAPSDRIHFCSETCAELQASDATIEVDVGCR